VCECARARIHLRSRSRILIHHFSFLSHLQRITCAHILSTSLHSSPPHSLALIESPLVCTLCTLLPAYSLHVLALIAATALALNLRSHVLCAPPRAHRHLTRFNSLNIGSYILRTSTSAHRHLTRFNLLNLHTYVLCTLPRAPHAGWSLSNARDSGQRRPSVLQPKRQNQWVIRPSSTHSTYRFIRFFFRRFLISFYVHNFLSHMHTTAAMVTHHYPYDTSSYSDHTYRMS
jgi:hypothetical protein